MGSWNGTCGISQMSISAGEPVKVVMIQNNAVPGEASGFCYSCGIASPISFAFDAEYNEYGAVEKITNDLGLKLFEYYFHKELQEGNIKIQPDDYYDREMKVQDGDYSNIKGTDLIDLIERDRVTRKVQRYTADGMVFEWSLVGFMLIHTNIYNSIQESIFASKTKYDGFTAEDVYNDCLYAVEDLFENTKLSKYSQASFDEVISELKELVKVEPRDETKIKQLKEDLEEITKNDASFSTRCWDNENIRKIGDWGNMVRRFSSYDSVDTTSFIDYFYTLKNSYKPELKEKIIKMMTEFIVIMDSMSLLRKSWMGQSGKGSQHFEENVTLGLIKGMQQVIARNREDLTGCSVGCISTVEINGLTFEEDEDYKIIKCDLENNAVIIGRHGIETITTYQNIMTHFEY